MLLLSDPKPKAVSKGGLVSGNREIGCNRSGGGVVAVVSSGMLKKIESSKLGPGVVRKLGGVSTRGGSVMSRV